jgi:hypothetical protein
LFRKRRHGPAARYVDDHAGSIWRHRGGRTLPTAPPVPTPRRCRPSVVGVSLLTAGWLIVAVLGLVVLLRLLAWDSVEPLIVLDALTLIVYLPAWVVTAGALIARGWWLAAAAALIVAAQLVFAGPELSAAAPLPAGLGTPQWCGYSTRTSTRVLTSGLVTHKPSSRTGRT